MARKRKISELPLCTDFHGLRTIGTDKDNNSVAVSLDYIQETVESMQTATTNANNAADRVDASITDITAEKKAAIDAATTATNSSKEADKQANRAKQQADNPPKIGDNGNWWKWDETAQKYVDTGILAKGGVLYPSFLIDEDNMHLVMYYQDEIAKEQFVLNEETGHLTFNFR